MTNRRITNELIPSKWKDTAPTIGVLIGDIRHKNDYSMWQGVVDAAKKRDVNVICFPGLPLHSPYGFEAQANVIYDLVSAEKLDGLVIMAGAISQFDGLEEKKAFIERYYPLPIVTLENHVAGPPNLYVDSFQNMRKAVLHLIQAHNYHRIAFIRGPENHQGANERYRAYVETLAEYGLPLDPALVTPPLNWDGKQGVAWLLDQQQVDFEALIGANDDTAIEAIEALQARGIRVPEEVAVVGFDDVDQSRWITPPLTTIPIESYKWGQQALEMILALLEGKPVPDQVAIPTELVVRQSCGCIDPAVMQVVLEAAVSLSEGSAERIPLETFLLSRQEDILVAIKQTVGEETLKIEPGQIGQLLEAFSAEWGNTSNGIFLRMLDQILRQTIVTGSEIEGWYQVVSGLRRQILPYLPDSEALLWAENLWQQARVLIGKTAQRVQGYQKVLAERRMSLLREIGAALITTFDSEVLLNVLVHQLPQLGIPGAYLALYEDPQQPTGQARLLLAYNEQGRIEIEAGGRVFPALQLVPPGLWPRERRYNMVVMPLYLQKEQLGFVLFEANSQDGPMYEALRGQISSALKGALLVEQEEKRARQLQTVAEVGTVVSTILDKTELLQSVVDLTKASFNLYHTHIYLLNGAGDTLTLVAGAGEVGRQMVAREWSIPLTREKSLVARAARTRQGIIENNVQKAPDWLPNPLLPNTHSELAVPMVVGERLLGVLDMQSDEIDHFTEEDVRIQTILAAQVAVALDNAGSFAEQQQAKLLLGKRVRELNCLNEIGREIVETPPITELLQWVAERIPPAMQYSDLCVVAIEYNGQTYGVPEAINLPAQITNALRIGNEVMGRMYIAYTEKYDFLDEESALLGGVASRVSGYIENQRLLNQMQQRAAELEEVTNFLDSIIENIPLGIFIKEAKDLKYLRINRAHANFSGLNQIDVIGTTVYNYFPKEQADFFTAKDQETLARGELVDIPEQPMQSINKGLRWLHTQKVPIYGADGQPKYLLGISEDITEWKQAKQTIVQQKEFLSKIINILPVGVFAKDVQNEYRFSIWNAKMEELFGTKAEAILGKNDYDVFPKEEADYYRETDTSVMDGRQIVDISAEEVTTAKGIILSHTTKLPIYNSEGQPETLLGILENITEPKRAEQALIDSEARYKAITETMPGAIYQFTARQGMWTIDYMAPQALEMFGVSAEDCMKDINNFIQHIHPDDLPGFTASVVEVMEKLTPWRYEGRFIKPTTGEIVWWQGLSTPSATTSGEVIFNGILLDLTARKLAEEERERLLAEVEVAYRRYVRQEWEQFLGKQQDGWRVEHPQSVPHSTSQVQHLTSDKRLAEVQGEVIREGKTKIIAGASSNGHKVEPTIVAPIALRGQIIGTFSLQDNASERKWTDEEMALVETVSEQLALTVENLRLFDDTQKRATREALTREIADKIRQANTVEEILQTSVAELSKTFDVSRIFIDLSPQESSE